MITPQQNDAEPTAETTVDLSYTDELGEYDFEDYTFNFITRDNGWSYSNMIAEEQDGEVLSDAIFKRQQTVSERFNVQFAETFGDTNTVKTKFKEAVLAGDNAYDMITARGMDMYTFAQEGLLNPVSALPHLNLEKAYWSLSMTEQVNVYSNYYFAISDISVSSYDSTHVLLFSKKRMEDAGRENIYDVVKRGDWTYDEDNIGGTTLSNVFESNRALFMGCTFYYIGRVRASEADFGIIFCEAAGILPIVGLNLEETPETYARFVSYCNSPDDETRRREPYNIKYLQIANESNIDEYYVERFKAAALAVWQVDPDITLIPAGKVYGFTGDEELDAVRQKLAPHLELTEFVHDRQKKLIWDAHSFMLSDDMTEPLGKHSHIRGAVGFSKLLTRLSPRLGVVKVGLMELNAGRYNHHRGLTHALEMQALHSEPEIFELAAMPNVSQPWDIYQIDWKAVLWTQGNIYYTQKRVFFQSAYYVDKIIGENWANEIIETELSSSDDTLHVISGRCPGGDIVIRVVNTSPEARTITLDTDSIDRDRLELTSLSGEPLEYNTLSEPEKIAPVSFTEPVTKPRHRLSITAHSFTLIRLRGHG